MSQVPPQPPDYPYYQPGQYQPPATQLPPMPRQKKSRKWPWILAIVIVFFMGYGIGHSSSPTTTTTATTTQAVATTAPQSTVAPVKPTTAPVPTVAPKVKVWTTEQTFTGNGSKKTATFVVGNDWKILWSCVETNGLDSPFFLTVYDPSNSMVDAPQTTCKASTTTTGETEEHQAGTFYLDVNTSVAWVIRVQEMK
jgi:hypothetical protein